MRMILRTQAVIIDRKRDGQFIERILAFQGFQIIKRKYCQINYLEYTPTKILGVSI